MIGHSQRLAQPLTRAQKRLIAAVVVGILAAAVVAVSRAGAGAPPARAGCVNYIVASSTGGVLLTKCGGAARSWCRSQRVGTDAAARDAQALCRVAGLPAPAVPAGP